MRVTIEHVFDGIGLAEYEAAYFDESFNVELGKALHMGRKLLRLDRSADRIVRHVCYEPRREPDSPADKAFGKSRASFVEELDYDVRARRGTWRTIPNVFPDRVRNIGAISFVDTPRGVKRVLEGDVTVKLFGFGGRVEKLIVAEIEKSYANSAVFTAEWLARSR